MISKCKSTVRVNANCLYQANSNNKQGLVAHIGQDDKPIHEKEMYTLESLEVAQADQWDGKDPAFNTVPEPMDNSPDCEGF